MLYVIQNRQWNCFFHVGNISTKYSYFTIDNNIMQCTPIGLYQNYNTSWDGIYFIVIIFLIIVFCAHNEANRVIMI